MKQVFFTFIVTAILLLPFAIVGQYSYNPFTDEPDKTGASAPPATGAVDSVNAGALGTLTCSPSTGDVLCDITPGVVARNSEPETIDAEWNFTVPPLFPSLGIPTAPCHFWTIAPEGTTTASPLAATNTIYFYKVIIPFTCTFDELVGPFQNTNVASSKAQIAIYDASFNLLEQSSIYDTSTGTITARVTTLGSPRTMRPGVYFFTFAGNSTNTWSGKGMGTAGPVYNTGAVPTFGTFTGVWSDVTGFPATVSAPVGTPTGLHVWVMGITSN